jgi:hypothetical protein
MISFSRLSLAILSSTLLALLGFTVPSAAQTPETGTPSAEEPYNPQIDPADFSTTIDNPYFPLIPGTTFVLEGTKEGEKQHNDVIVTDATITIMGVTCVVVEDRVLVNDVITELTFDWYAQDKDGNVWYFGEDSTAFEEGQPPDTGGSWEAGVEGALPGIIMPGEPKVGDVYRQEYWKGEAEDFAEVTAVTGTITVPYGTFDHTLVTKEWSPLEPDVIEGKTYAPGAGVVMEDSPSESERMELIDILKAGEQASPEATPSS